MHCESCSVSVLPENMKYHNPGHLCGPGLILRPSVMCGLSLLLVLILVSNGSHGYHGYYSGFLPSTKTTLLNSNLITIQRVPGLSVTRLLFATLIK